MQIKVSVCIPVYGVEKYIECCARSLFEQTMQEGIEFIFVNDCTPDKSIEVLKAVLEEYPHRKEQVKIIHHEKNQGLVGARKTALKYVQGEYVIHCDSDDWVDVTMYEKLYSKAKEMNADMVYCDFIRCESDTYQKKISVGEETDCDQLICLLLRRMTMAIGTLWNRLYRFELVKKVDIDELPNKITYGEDLLHNLHVLPYCKLISKVNEALYYYRTGVSSICSQFKNNLSLRRNIFQIQFYLDEFLDDEIYREAMDSSRRLALYSAISSGVTTAREWHRLWKPAKRGMWRDKRWNIAQKIIFYAACVNFTLTSFVFKLLTGRLKDARQ